MTRPFTNIPEINHILTWHGWAGVNSVERQRARASAGVRGPDMRRPNFLGLNGVDQPAESAQDEVKAKRHTFEWFSDARLSVDSSKTALLSEQQSDEPRFHCSESYTLHGRHDVMPLNLCRKCYVRRAQSSVRGSPQLERGLRVLAYGSRARASKHSFEWARVRLVAPLRSNTIRMRCAVLDLVSLSTSHHTELQSCSSEQCTAASKDPARLLEGY